MATGRNPFVGQSASSTIANILKEEAPPLEQHNPAAPFELGRILQKCLRKRIDERYVSARDLALDLEALRRSLEPSGRTSAVVAAGPASPISISPGAARALLMLLPIPYLAMDPPALHKFPCALPPSPAPYR